MDLGTKHVVVCARIMCKQCFAESKRVVQLGNERSVILCPPCFVSRREEEEWTGLFARKVGSKTSFLLTEREGCTGEYWAEVVAVRTERSEVRTKTTEGQYSSVRLELARFAPTKG